MQGKSLARPGQTFSVQHMILSDKVGVRPPCASVGFFLFFVLFFSSISWSFSAAFSAGRLWWFPVVCSHVAARFCRG